jgi:hypothetical protein
MQCRYEALARAERLRELQARNAERAAAGGQDYESLLAGIRREYNAREGVRAGLPDRLRPVSRPAGRRRAPIRDLAGLTAVMAERVCLDLALFFAAVALT